MLLQSNITQQHVTIVGDGSLFDQAITQLLTRRADLLVSRSVYSDELAFLNIIRQGRPDVILVNESGSLDAVRILDLVSSHPMVMGLCIVIVRLCNNVIDVYERPIFVVEKISCSSRRIIVRTGDDLLNALRRKQNDQRKSRI
jgi:hypothetical protein